MVLIELCQAYLLLVRPLVLQCMVLTVLVLTHCLTWSFLVVLLLKTPRRIKSLDKLKRNCPKMLVSNQFNGLMVFATARESNQPLKLELVCKRLCKDMLLCSVVKTILKKVVKSFMNSHKVSMIWVSLIVVKFGTLI